MEYVNAFVFKWQLLFLDFPEKERYNAECNGAADGNKDS